MASSQLGIIAAELLEKVRENTTGDCTVKEIVRIEMRVMVSRIIKKCGYPPELGEKATRTVWEWSSRLSGGAGGRRGAKSLNDRRR